MSTKIPLITTAEQLLAASDELGPCELVRGELIMMTPAGDRHSRIEGKLYATLVVHVDAHGLGQLYTGDAGFLMQQDPDTVRSPDVALVCASRVPTTACEGYFPGPPDLAVEIRSPTDRSGAIAAKIAEYLRLGVQVVWDVDPAVRTVTVHRPDTEPQVFGQEDTLTEPALLPGFAILVGQLFP